MAVSVSKIAVQVTGETAQLTSAMTQASRSVNTLTQSQVTATAATTKLTSASGNANFAINQLIFAADDAATSFGTQGWSGAIRAASNNLTMLAATSGNLYVFLGTVAVTAVAQLTSKYWDQNDAIKEQIDLLGQLQERQGRLARELRGFRELGDARQRKMDLQELTDFAPGGPGAGAAAAIDVGKEQEQVSKELERMQKDLEVARLEADIARQDLESALENPPLEGTPEEAAKQLDNLRKEADAAQKRLQNLEAINRQLEEQARLLEKLRQQQRDTTLGGAGDVGGSLFTDEMRKDIEDARKEFEKLMEDARKELDESLGRDFNVFGKLPGVMQSGSSAAVSAINQASAGSRNVSDQQRLLQNSDRTVRALERIRELEEKQRENNAQVVGV